MQRISSQYASGTSIDNKPSKKLGLGKDDFLKLLITELKNQNPLEPMDSREYITQLAQFNSLEQMINLNDRLAHFSALSMIGKHVKTYGGEVSGVVKGVILEKGDIRLIIGDEGTKVPIDEVNEIR